MIKRICDRCGKDITNDAVFELSGRTLNAAGELVYANGSSCGYDLCPDCKLEFDNFMTEKKGFEKHDD